jgi:ATP-binding cassette subfamily F protein uup
VWLEELLNEGSFACVLVSHDRYFLENVATEIVELNRVYADGLLRVKGSYSKFLEGKQAYVEAQSKLQDALKNRVKIEVDWLRRGPKARSTKAKARIDNAQELIGQLKEVNARVQTSSAGIDFSATDRQTKRLVELEDVSVVLGDRRIVEGFSQMRELEEGVTLRRALAPDSDSVVYQGRVVHVASYATKFLFTSEQLNQPVERLSGGERARVLIAKLMLEPADLLLLDEPTNDLDIATLEILEDSLLEYTGALVLVTHDRYMLDRVSTVVLGLDGRGSAEMFADYSQWEQWRGAKVEEAIAPGATGKAVASVSAGPASNAGGKKKLSYLEAREFAGIEAAVEAAEARLQRAREMVEDPAVAVDAVRLTAALAEMEAAQAEADGLYARWAELTEKAG